MEKKREQVQEDLKRLDARADARAAARAQRGHRHEPDNGQPDNGQPENGEPENGQEAAAQGFDKENHLRRLGKFGTPSNGIQAIENVWSLHTSQIQLKV